MPVRPNSHRYADTTTVATQSRRPAPPAPDVVAHSSIANLPVTRKSLDASGTTPDIQTQDLPLPFRLPAPMTNGLDRGQKKPALGKRRLRFERTVWAVTGGNFARLLLQGRVG